MAAGGRAGGGDAGGTNGQLVASECFCCPAPVVAAVLYINALNEFFH